MEMQQEHELASHLRACGHFLFYQTGGKAGQRRILVTLLRQEPLTQKELQDALDISSGALSEILQKMEDSGLVERKKSSDDRRQVELTLSAGGREIALQMKAHYHRTLEKMFECLSGTEKRQLGEILAKLVAHMDTLKADAVCGIPLIDPCEEAAGQSQASVNLRQKMQEKNTPAGSLSAAKEEYE